MCVTETDSGARSSLGSWRGRRDTQAGARLAGGTGGRSTGTVTFLGDQDHWLLQGEWRGPSPVETHRIAHCILPNRKWVGSWKAAQCDKCPLCPLLHAHVPNELQVLGGQPWWPGSCREAGLVPGQQPLLPRCLLRLRNSLVGCELRPRGQTVIKEETIVSSRNAQSNFTHYWKSFSGIYLTYHSHQPSTKWLFCLHMRTASAPFGWKYVFAGGFGTSPTYVKIILWGTCLVSS